MASVKSSPTSWQQELVAAWRETGRLLEIQRYVELAAQSPMESRQAAFDMLQLGGMLPMHQVKEQGSGLIEMQRFFARRYDRGRV